MNPSGPERRRAVPNEECTEPSPVPSMLLPEGGAIRRMSERFVAHPVTGIGSVTAYNRGTSSNCDAAGRNFQTPPDLVVKVQYIEIVDVILWRLL